MSLNQYSCNVFSIYLMDIINFSEPNVFYYQDDPDFPIMVLELDINTGLPRSIYIRHNVEANMLYSLDVYNPPLNKPDYISVPIFIARQDDYMEVRLR